MDRGRGAPGLGGGFLRGQQLSETGAQSLPRCPSQVAGRSQVGVVVQQELNKLEYRLGQARIRGA
jgi:hypothetical protein